MYFCVRFAQSCKSSGLDFCKTIYAPAADVKAVFFTDDKTEGHMGVSELLLATTINGILFSVLSGQPLLMIGLSGTVLVFEEELYKVWMSGQNEIGSDKDGVRLESVDMHAS